MADTPAEDIVHELLPLHGPYSRDNTIRACTLVDELIRYLNYATQHAEGLPWPVAAYDLIGALKVATGKLPQTLRQTGVRVGAFAKDPNVVNRSMDYRAPEAAHTDAVARSISARAELNHAANLARELSARLTAAQTLLSPIGLLDVDDDE